MEHRTIFYNVNHPLPQRLNIEELFLFPVTSSVHAIYEKCKHERTEECSQMWDLFAPLFKSAFINWGAVGIIKEKISSSGSFPYQYSWHFYAPQETKRLNDFANGISQCPEDYFLLGNTAESMFDISQDKNSIPCLAIIEDSELEKVSSYKKWLEAKGWREKDTPFIQTSKLTAWRNYIAAVEQVADQGSIIYIPAICHHHHEAKGDPVLAGGLIWCTKRGRLKEALEYVSEAQLFLRWTISELLTLYPHLGMPSNPVERIATALIVLHEFKTQWETGELHNPTEESVARVQKEFEFSYKIREVLDGGKLHEGVKALMLDDIDYEIPLAVLIALMESVAKVEVSIRYQSEGLRQTKIPINGLIENKFDAKVSFLKSFLHFIRNVPYDGTEHNHQRQKWDVEISEEREVVYLQMQAVSSAEKLDMNIFDDYVDEKKLEGSSGLWAKLKVHAPKVKLEKVGSSKSRIGFSIGPAGELIIFWKMPRQERL